TSSTAAAAAHTTAGQCSRAGGAGAVRPGGRTFGGAGGRPRGDGGCTAGSSRRVQAGSGPAPELDRQLSLGLFPCPRCGTAGPAPFPLSRGGRRPGEGAKDVYLHCALPMFVFATVIFTRAGVRAAPPGSAASRDGRPDAENLRV